MSKIKWDQIGQRKFKTGVDHGVLYLFKNGEYTDGVAWNGLTSVNKTPSGAEENKMYADNIQYLNMRSAETLGLTIECYFYPDEWAECNGETELGTGVFIGQQRRNIFGFSYRNKIGNDVEGEDHGYELNLIYGCTASPSEQTNQTVNESPEAATFSYEVSTTPIVVDGIAPDGKPYKPTASVTIDSTKTSKDVLTKLEEILYGKDGEFIKSMDTGMSSEKDYYIIQNGEYVKVDITEFDPDITYYECTVDPVPARLPMPNELLALLAAG